jgi:hypothetical protein
LYYHPSVSSRARGDSWGAANLDLRAIFLGGLRSLAGGKPDACNQEPFFDFALHRVTLLHFVQHRTYPIDDKPGCPRGFSAAIRRLEFGFRFELVLKTKDRIGFVS